MSAKSTTYAQSVLNTMRGTALAAWTPRLALFVGDPLAGGVEVTGGAYARVTVTMAAPVGATAANSAGVTFPTPTGSWGIVTHAALMDAASGGTVRYATILPGSDVERTIIAGTPVSFAIGTLTFTEL